MYFDAANGVSGDMFVGALIDLGADFERIKRDVMALGLDIELIAEKSSSRGIAATKFTVLDKTTGHEADSGHDHHHEHRHLSDIQKMINNAGIKESIKESALFIFEMIGQAEAEAHGVDIDAVHFHEVGALDSIADIVAAASAMDQFGADYTYSSSLNTGSGTVICQHGVLPVPVPAVLNLLPGMSAYSDGIKSELATPTGTALLKYFTDCFADMPKMLVEGNGCGMGTRNTGRPNVFRIILGEGQFE